MKSVRSKEKLKLSQYFKPMLATLAESSFNDPLWIFEIKWDGYRAIAELQKGKIELYSRNGLSFKPLYPSIVEALKKLKVQAVLDGEIVVFNERGKPDFQKLQQFGELKNGSLVYYVFDCLSVEGQSITHLPLLERKEIVKKITEGNSTIRYADHVTGEGIEFFQHAKSMDLEGIIAKRSESLYHPGKRTNDWLKIKNHNTQEAIIAGYTRPRGSRQYFGALILAIRKGQQLTYIGHTGTGFNNKTLHDIYKKLQHLNRLTSPFPAKVPVRGDVNWVEPKLVCNIKFSEVTQGGILRHPVFMGLRIDKSANEADHLELAPSNNRLSSQSPKTSRRRSGKQVSR